MAMVQSLPYKGSKRKIAQQLLSCMPSASYFVDAMAGGGAMTSCAIMSGRYEHVLMNDIEPGLVELYRKSVQGDFSSLPILDFIDRERFEREKLNDAYIRFVWSFGNNGRDYLYGRGVEPLKRAIHHVVCYNDYSLLASLGIWLPELKTKPSIKGRRKELRELIYKYAPKGLIEHYGNEMHRLQHLERLDLLFELNNLKDIANISNIKYSSVSYESVDNYIPKGADCIYYYDIPYQGTNNYGKFKEKSLTFNKKVFCDYIRNSPNLCFISEYSMPDDFVCIKEISHTSTMCATLNKKTTERLFVHESKIDRLK